MTADGTVIARRNKARRADQMLRPHERYRVTKDSRDFCRVIPPSLESLLRRFFLGTDGVAPVDQRQYLRVFYQPGPLWNLLNKNASEKVRKLNYERIFY